MFLDKIECVKKLEITRKLERLQKTPSSKGFGNLLDSSIAILNLPAPFYCNKGCEDCVTREERSMREERKGRLPLELVTGYIEFFAKNYDTRFITINGRGNPFHAEVKHETLDKIAYAYSRGIQSFVFTAGNNLDEEVCQSLARQEVNVIMSLFGNDFIDRGFFEGTAYKGEDALIAENLRRLIRTYRSSHNQPEEGTTRLGMNYVVSEGDLRDQNKLIGLKEAANENGLFFVCNVNFIPHPDPKIRGQLMRLALKNSNFNLAHSTFVDGRCQMGAGSSVTIAADGEVYRCPYMLEGEEGKITEISNQHLAEILAGYLNDRRYMCVLRETKAEK